MGKGQASFSSFSFLLVIRVDVGLGLDFTLHARMYGKAPLPSPRLVVVAVVLHDATPSQYNIVLKPSALSSHNITVGVV